MDVDEKGKPEREKVVDRARKALLRGKDWETEVRNRYLEDTKFANGDARNMFQWPERLRELRMNEGDRPCLTINKVRTHNRMIINDSLKNKQSIRIRPTGGSASFESAKMMMALVRRIEYISSANTAYAKAMRTCVDGGMGYVTLDTAYISDRSFDQDVYIRRCNDPLGIMLDPDIEEEDGSDANWGMIYRKMLRDDFDRRYPKFKDKVGTSTLGDDPLWVDDKHVLLAKYYERTQKKDFLISFVHPQSKERFTGLRSDIEEDAKGSGINLYKTILEQIQAGELEGDFREVENQEVRWYLIGGDQLIDDGDWAGRYIPIARLVADETIIDGKVDRKSHTRQLIDPQRMMNYNASGAVEFGALQSKVPWTGAADAFEGQEQWKDANVKNYAFLAFNHLDNEGQPLPQQALPQRAQPPVTAPVYQQGMQDAEQQMMMASGQYQAQFGENENAKSGKAINERQQQGDTATYHFVDAQWNMLRYIGMMVIDLIPKIYDTERVLKCTDDKGEEFEITIDPNAKQALQEIKKEGETAKQIIFNPNVGEYEVVSDPGPNYATQRQEAWNAISMILTQNMQLAAVIGDLLFKFGDFPGAEELMERLQKEIKATKPYLFDEDADPGMVALQQQVQKLGALNGELVQKLAEMQIKLKGREEQKDIDAFNADTTRLKVQLDTLTKLLLTPDQQAQMEHDLQLQLGDHIGGMIADANRATLAQKDQPVNPAEA